MDHCPFTFINTACSWLDMSSSTFSWLFYATCCRVCYFYFTFYEMTIFNFYLPRWNLAFFFSYKLRYVSFLFFRGFVVVTTYTIMEALETIKKNESILYWSMDYNLFFFPCGMNQQLSFSGSVKYSKNHGYIQCNDRSQYIDLV